MSTPRKLGVFFCLLGFVAVCVLAIISRANAPFSGLRGIESDLANQASAIAVDQGAFDAEITAEGRTLNVQLPDSLPAGFDSAALQNRLAGIDGVREVTVFDPINPGAGSVDDQGSEATAEPEPTTAPAVADEPTPEAAPEPTQEPTPEPAPEPTVAPVQSLAEVVASIDLDAVDFEPGTARFTAQDTAVLDIVADQLQGLSGGPVQVQAHTDNVGDPDVNLLLSQDRANAIVAYLIDRGVDASLLTSRGFGAQLPIADNTTEQGRDANERVELVVEGN